MSGLNRLRKRREEYLKQYGIFQNAEQEDVLYAYKKSCAEEFKNLNRVIRERSPFDEAGNRRNLPDNGILSDQQMAEMTAQYEKTVGVLNQLTMAAREEQLRMQGEISRGASKSETKRMRNLQSRYQKEMDAYDLLANTLSKDLNAFFKVQKEGKHADLHEIYEQSRVRSDYTVVGAKQSRDKGNQNERIPVTIQGPDGKPVKGYFTPDNHAPSDSLVADEMAAVRKKYGKEADFIKDKELLDIRKSFFAQRTEASARVVNRLISHREDFAMGGYEEAVRTLSENTSYPLESYIDTPKKLNIFLDLLATTCSAKNRLNINQGIGIRPNGNVNRRNAAMSRMAQLLGCPELIAHSENMKLQIDGKEMKGTFMREAKGEDLNKLTEHSPMLCSTEGSMNSLQLKKQLADLQILDYLCGNPDRHGGNLFYQYDRKKDGSVVMRSVCGIDNDSSFGEKDLEKMGMSEVLPEDMRVITGSMASMIMKMDGNRLKTMFYGYELNAVELDNMKKRLERLQTRIKHDSERYKDGYQKGYLIPGTIKIVEDEELNELSMSKDLAVQGRSGRRNLFCTVNAFSRGKGAVEEVWLQKKSA